MWKHLPPLRLVRFPEKLIVPMSLATAVFAGAGWERLRGCLSRLAARTDERVKATRPLAALVVIALVLLVLALIASQSERWLPAHNPHWPPARIASLQSSALPSMALELAFATSALLLVAWAAKGRAALVGSLLVVLVALDLASPALRMNRSAPGEDWSAAPPLAALLEKDARAPFTRFRVSSQSLGLSPRALNAAAAEEDTAQSLALYHLREQSLQDASPARWGVRNDRGYSGITPGALHEIYMESKDGGVLDLLSVRYGVEIGDAPSKYAALGFLPRPDLVAALTAQFPELATAYLRIHENPQPLPGAWLSPEILIGPQTVTSTRCNGHFVPSLDEKDLSALAIALPRASSCAGLALHAEAGAPFYGTAEIESYEHERLSVRVDAPAPALLVLAESALPGWRAFVDGAETPVLSADTALRAAAVPAGRHQVLFQYAAPGLRTGALVSAISLLLFAALALFSRRNRPA